MSSWNVHNVTRKVVLMSPSKRKVWMPAPAICRLWLIWYIIVFLLYQVAITHDVWRKLAWRNPIQLWSGEYWFLQAIYRCNMGNKVGRDIFRRAWSSMVAHSTSSGDGCYLFKVVWRSFWVWAVLSIQDDGGWSHDLGWLRVDQIGPASNWK